MAGIDSYVKLFITSGNSYANNSTVFVDGSEANRTITCYGTVRHRTTEPHFFTTSIEAYLNSHSRLGVPPSADFDAGTGDFTIDCWLYDSFRTSATREICSKGWILSIKNNGAISFWAPGAVSLLSADMAVPGETWTHVAVVRNGNSWTIYANGVSVATATSTAVLWYYADYEFLIGPNATGTNVPTLRFEEFRFSKGIARWTANFTPPTAPYTSPFYVTDGLGGCVTGGDSLVKFPQMSYTSTAGAIVGGDGLVHFSVYRCDSVGGCVLGGTSSIKIPQLSAIGLGGSVLGGAAHILASISLVASGGAIAGGSPHYYVFLSIRPTKHYKCESITDDHYSEDSIYGGLPLYFGGASVVGGKFNSALDPNDLVRLQPYGDASFGSISLWFKRRSIGSYGNLLSNDDNTKLLSIFVTNELSLSGTAPVIGTGAFILDLEWHHLVFSKGTTNTKVKIFLDGLKIGTEFDHDWSAGVAKFAYGTVNCILDNIQFYTRTLSEEESVYLFYQTTDDTPFPMAFIGGGGAVVGGDANFRFPLAFIGDAGAVCSGVCATAVSYFGGPLQHWTFEDPVEIGRNEILNGATLNTSESLRISGKFGSAINGTANQAQVLYTSEPVAFKSVSLWLKRYDMYNACYFLAQNIGQLDNFFFIHTSPPNIGVLTTLEGVVYSDLQILEDTEWHHICIVEGSDESYHYIYLDGVRSSTELYSPFNTFRCLSRPTESQTSFRNPKLDDIQVYGHPLSDAEVLHLYTAISDYTVLPKLPYYVHPDFDGGAILGGFCDILYHNATTIADEPFGGAIIGGNSIHCHDWLYADGTYPEYTGDSVISVYGKATVNGVYPEYIGEITTGWNSSGVYPSFIGHLNLLHTVLSSVLGSYPRYIGLLDILSTSMTDIYGIYPKYSGSSNIYISDLIDIEGMYPNYIGDGFISVVCNITFLGIYPSYRGSSIIKINDDTDYILRYHENHDGPCGTLDYLGTDNILAYTRNM